MLKINERYFLSADNLNIILNKKMLSKKETKKEYFVAEGYFSSLHNALKELVNRGIKETHLESLNQVIDKIDELYKLINSLPDISVEDLG